MDLFAAMAQASQRGEPFVIATVVGTGGSAPQRSGAKMLVRHDGSIAGTAARRNKAAFLTGRK